MKKNTVKIRLIILIAIMLSNYTINASNLKKVAQSGMQYLKVGIDAKMVGRGEAGISLVDDVSSSFWNPAGLTNIRNQSYFFSHNSWIADISFDAFAMAFNFGNIGVVGFNALWVDYGELFKTSVAQTIEESSAQGYVDEGTFSPIDIALGISYARKISGQFSIGGQVRYLYENYGSNVIVTLDGDEKLKDNTISSLCFDLGTRYNTDFKSLAFSMTIQNFAPDMKYHYESFSPPLTFKMGVSIDLMDFYNETSKSQLLVAVDALHPRDYTERINVGAEYDYMGLFQVRSGYRYNYDEGNLSLGAGMRYSLNGLRFRCDVSYLMMTENRFASPIQISTSVDF